MDILEELEDLLTDLCTKALQFVSRKTVKCIIKLLFNRLKDEFEMLISLLGFDIFIRDQFLYLVKKIMDETIDELVEIDKILSRKSEDGILKPFEPDKELEHLDEVISVKLLIEKLLNSIRTAFGYLLETTNEEYMKIIYT